MKKVNLRGVMLDVIGTLTKGQKGSFDCEYLPPSFEIETITLDDHHEDIISIMRKDDLDIIESAIVKDYERFGANDNTVVIWWLYETP